MASLTIAVFSMSLDNSKPYRTQGQFIFMKIKQNVRDHWMFSLCLIDGALNSKCWKWFTTWSKMLAKTGKWVWWISLYVYKRVTCQIPNWPINISVPDEVLCYKYLKFEVTSTNSKKCKTEISLRAQLHWCYMIAKKINPANLCTEIYIMS